MKLHGQRAPQGQVQAGAGRQRLRAGSTPCRCRRRRRRRAAARATACCARAPGRAASPDRRSPRRSGRPCRARGTGRRRVVARDGLVRRERRSDVAPDDGGVEAPAAVGVREDQLGAGAAPPRGCGRERDRRRRRGRDRRRAGWWRRAGRSPRRRRRAGCCPSSGPEPDRARRAGARRGVPAQVRQRDGRAALASQRGVRARGAVRAAARWKPGWSRSASAIVAGGDSPLCSERPSAATSTWPTPMSSSSGPELPGHEPALLDEVVHGLLELGGPRVGVVAHRPLQDRVAGHHRARSADRWSGPSDTRRTAGPAAP